MSAHAFYNLRSMHRSQNGWSQSRDQGVHELCQHRESHIKKILQLMQCQSVPAKKNCIACRSKMRSLLPVWEAYYQSSLNQHAFNVCLISVAVLVPGSS